MQDEHVRQIFDYVLKLANYDTSLLLRQKARVLNYLVNEDHKIPIKEVFKKIDQPPMPLVLLEAQPVKLLSTT